MDEPPAASFSGVNEHADEPFTAYRRHDIPHIAIIYPILSGEPLISANERAFVSFFATLPVPRHPILFSCVCA